MFASRLQYIEARENGNCVAGGDGWAISIHKQETVCVRQGRYISGTLPPQDAHLRRCHAGPLETRW